MKEFKMMQDQLMSAVKAQMNDLSCVDTNELGEAIDMIQDLSQTMYYCAAAKALEEPEETRYYGGPRRRISFLDYDEETY